jgi:hypothetical protein
LLLGLLVTVLAVFVPMVLGSVFSSSSTSILLVLLVAAGVTAFRLPNLRTLMLSMIAGGIGGFILLAAVILFVLQDGLFSTTVQDDLKPAALEQWIGLDFPASASNMRSHAEGFQDWQVFVRFEMPKSDLPEFLRLNKLEPELNPNTHLANADLERDWWTPDGTTKPRLFVPTGKPGAETQPSTKTGFYPTIQISDLEGDLVTVYISAFNT